MSETGFEFPAGVHGVNSTGPCPPGLLSGLLERSLERMVEVYGSSETGGIGWREDPGDPCRLLPHWTLTEGGESLVRHLPDGSFGEPISAPDHLVPIPGGFALGGRRDHAVQVGGVNVFPERVAEIIRSHPDVSDCEVRLMRPDEGGRLKAFVVLEELENRAREANGDVRQERQELELWLRQTLSAPERPVSPTFGESVPRNEQGKISDWP
jgi:4-coumarate--CoA ligase